MNGCHLRCVEVCAMNTILFVLSMNPKTTLRVYRHCVLDVSV